MEESFAAQMIAYHEASKHHYRTYAPGPGYLDSATQPDPFRRYTGAAGDTAGAARARRRSPLRVWLHAGSGAVAPLDASSVSRLLFDTLAISAWKEFGESGGRYASTRPAATCTQPRVT